MFCQLVLIRICSVVNKLAMSEMLLYDDHNDGDWCLCHAAVRLVYPKLRSPGLDKLRECFGQQAAVTRWLCCSFWSRLCLPTDATATWRPRQPTTRTVMSQIIPISVVLLSVDDFFFTLTHADCIPVITRAPLRLKLCFCVYRVMCCVIVTRWGWPGGTEA